MVNKLKKINPDFKPILKSLSELADREAVRVYLVGGVVRDLVLGEKIFDLDVVVEANAIAFAHKFAILHKKQFKKHHAFGTATVDFDKHHIDFVTARSESYSCYGALPKVKPASLREDLFRRDFSINAMAISLNKSDYGRLIDFYSGERDLRKGLIRVLHEISFLDDSTRILRAIRFEQRFLFKIEGHTLGFLKEAISKNAFSLVNPHRLREELILILKEPKPCRYIKRLYMLTALTFMGVDFRLDKKDFALFAKIEKILNLYNKKFKKHRRLEEWLIYLIAILIKLNRQDSVKFLENFGFRKGERIRVFSVFNNLEKIKELDTRILPHQVYKILNPLSFEAIIFFYAYYQNRTIRKHIEMFLGSLSATRLKLKGQDLKELGFKPMTLYGKIFERLMYAKIDKGLKSLEEEKQEAQAIFEKLSKG